MKLLIFGGTQFLGRNITELALGRGHELTLFHRGKTGADLFPEATHILGDRDGQLDRIGSGRFDAVLDISGYIPRLVRAAAQYVQPLTDHYVFISTISVYDPTDASFVDEDSALLTPPPAEVETVTGETYGGLKVACERAVQEVFPHATIVRPGLVGGPHDHTKRFDRWIKAAMSEKEFSIPARAEQSIQLVDVRDLANLTLDLAERKVQGTFNTTGVESNWSQLAAALQMLSGGSVTVTGEPDETAPMVIAGNDVLFRCRHDRAAQHGFTPRTIAEMVADGPNWPQNLA